jgi:hypothetical protein
MAEKIMEPSHFMTIGIESQNRAAASVLVPLFIDEILKNDRR